MQRLLLPILLFSLVMPHVAHAEWRKEGQHLKLINLLDRKDGYCLDVAGSGNHVRFDLPLLTHNCKEGLYADEAVVYNKDKTISFPAYNTCLTVMGVNDSALPYNALMLKRCNIDEPFLKSTRFQKFSLTDNNQVQLDGSNLCITAGDTSKITYSPDHRWRSLYMQECHLADKSLSQWHFIKPLTN